METIYVPYIFGTLMLVAFSILAKITIDERNRKYNEKRSEDIIEF